MSDETPKSDTSAAPSATPTAPPPLPELFSFPVQLLEQWIALPDSTRLTGALTKQDVDCLLFGLLRGGEALSALEQTLVHWSNGEIDAANLRVSEARRLNIESANYYRRFFTGLMVATLRENPDGE